MSINITIERKGPELLTVRWKDGYGYDVTEEIRIGDPRFEVYDSMAEWETQNREEVADATQVTGTHEGGNL